jgi:hypothetical protein
MARAGLGCRTINTGTTSPARAASRTLARLVGRPGSGTRTSAAAWPCGRRRHRER